jgi:hypothetical protein
MESRERNARLTDDAIEAAALRAEAARQRRDSAARRLADLRDERTRDRQRLQTAAERTADASEAIAVAHSHAVQALDRSAGAHRASAFAHDRAAETAERFGNAEAAARHRRSAVKAREAANLDQHAADEQWQQHSRC